MRPNAEFGPYGGFSDPYHIPANAGPYEVVEAMYNGQTYLDALNAAENPQYQYVRDPATGQPVVFADGTPVVERIPMEQRLAPAVRRRQASLLRIKLLGLALSGLFILYGAVVVFSPAPVGEWLQKSFLPVVAYGVVWGGAALVAILVVRQILRALWKG